MALNMRMRSAAGVKASARSRYRSTHGSAAVCHWACKSHRWAMQRAFRAERYAEGWEGLDRRSASMQQIVAH